MYYPLYPEAATGTQKHVIVGLFETHEQLAAVLSSLEDRGYREEHISVAMTDERRGHKLAIEHHTKMPEGVVSGGFVGGLAGAMIAGLMSAGALATGGLNLVIAGPLLSTLAGFGAGAAAGGLVGGLIGAGIPEHDIELFSRHLHAGRILVAVETQGPEGARDVRRIFDREQALSTDESLRAETAAD